MVTNYFKQLDLSTSPKQNTIWQRTKLSLALVAGYIMFKENITSLARRKLSISGLMIWNWIQTLIINQCVDTPGSNRTQKRIRSNSSSRKGRQSETRGETKVGGTSCRKGYPSVVQGSYSLQPPFASIDDVRYISINRELNWKSNRYCAKFVTLFWQIQRSHVTKLNYELWLYKCLERHIWMWRRIYQAPILL